MNKKESVICEFEMDFKKYFCCNDDIISVLFQLVMLRFETTCGSENGWGKSHFCSEIWSEFGEPGGPPPPPLNNNSQEYPPAVSLGGLFQDLGW